MTSAYYQQSDAPALTFTGERILPLANSDILQQGVLTIHQALYHFIAPYCRQKRVLDVGCGTGHGTALLSSQPGAQVYGTDIARDAVGFAATYAPELASSLLVCDAHYLALIPTRFDIISMIEVLEHLSAADQLLTEVTRIMKPDGHCFISTPNRLVYSPDSSTPANPFHVIEYTYQEFVTLLRHFFAVVHVQCIVIQQRSFLARYYRQALPLHLPFPLANIERFLYWHIPPWNKRLLQPQHIQLTERYAPTCLGFLAICAQPLAGS